MFANKATLMRPVDVKANITIDKCRCSKYNNLNVDDKKYLMNKMFLTMIFIMCKLTLLPIFFVNHENYVSE